MEVMIYWSVVQCFATFGLGDYLWKQVQVAKALINVTNNVSYDTYFLKTKYVDLSKFACGSSCDNSNWCRTWCLDIDSEKCVKTNAIVSPLHFTNSTDTYQCYTHEEKDFIVGATVSSAPLYNNWKAQVPLVLVQGIYNFVRQMTCTFVGDGLGNPWLLFDLRTPQTIREIRVTTPYYFFYKEMPHGVEIRVGLQPPLVAQNNSTSGNFSNLELFGTLPIPCTNAMTYYFKSKRGKLIRYISIEQKVAISDRMSICQIMAL